MQVQAGPETSAVRSRSRAAAAAAVIQRGEIVTGVIEIGIEIVTGAIEIVTEVIEIGIAVDLRGHARAVSASTAHHAVSTRSVAPSLQPNLGSSSGSSSGMAA